LGGGGGPPPFFNFYNCEQIKCNEGWKRRSRPLKVGLGHVSHSPISSLRAKSQRGGGHQVKTRSNFDYGK